MAVDVAPPPDLPGLRGERVYVPLGGDVTLGDYASAERVTARFAKWAGEVYKLTAAPLP